MSLVQSSTVAAADALAVENVRLRKAMRDMLAIASLPAVWIGLGPDGIARSLASALLATLSLDLVYVRLGSPGSPETVDALRSRTDLDDSQGAAARASIEALINHSHGSGLLLPNPVAPGLLKAAITRFGVNDRSGVLITASGYADFPTETDRALLGVGANQTAIVLQRLHAELASKESRENLDAALQAADLGHWRLKIADGTIERNLRHDQIFGYDSRAKSWNYAAFLEHIAPEHREKVDAARQGAIGANGPWEVECQLAGPGQPRWIWVKGRVVHDTGGQPHVLTGVVADITHRKSTERELRDARSRLQAALTAGAILTWTWDIPANRIWADESLALMFGLDGTAAAGGELGPYLEAIHPEDRERVAASLRQALSAGGEYADDYRIPQPDGSIRWVAARGQVERDAGSHPIRMPGVLVDITQRKVLENELTVRVAQLAAMDQRKDEFLATLAHELRNPLAPIRNSLQILKMPRVDAATANRVRDVMDRQVNQLVRLVDDLLDVSRVMRGKIELRKEVIELSTVVARAVETVQPLIEAHGHALHIDLPQEPLLFEVDPVRLTQVIGNLLGNAAKYTDDGGAISIAAFRVDDEVVLRVRDNGIGIPGHMLPHVFDLFVQVDQSGGRSQGGLGIGLTLVRNLVEMHMGSVAVHSEGPGTGVEFEVRLPLASAHAAQLPATTVEPDCAARGQRVLVVDDNADAAQSLAHLLHLKGYRVRAATDGEAALSIAREFLPHLVLLDLGMPGMDGHEVARRIRDEPTLRNCTLAALTGWGQERDRLRTAESGFNVHLVKPVEAAELDRVLRDLDNP